MHDTFQMTYMAYITTVPPKTVKKKKRLPDEPTFLSSLFFISIDANNNHKSLADIKVEKKIKNGKGEKKNWLDMQNC